MFSLCVILVCILFLCVQWDQYFYSALKIQSKIVDIACLTSPIREFKTFWCMTGHLSSSAFLIFSCHKEFCLYMYQIYFKVTGNNRFFLQMNYSVSMNFFSIVKITILITRMLTLTKTHPQMQNIIFVFAYIGIMREPKCCKCGLEKLEKLIPEKSG